MQITPNMVGIHGTNDPRTVGDVASLGCVRLYPEAARELYDLVAVGTPVHIVYEQVRVGQEPDGTLVWTFFPDPYHQWFPVFEAQKALERARSQGHEIELSDFEIEDAIPQTLGLLSPVFGRPVTVKRGDQVSRGKAYLKATGLWLDPEVLQTSGCTVTAAAGAKSAQISSTDGRAVVVTADPLPLNPQRTPKVLGQQPWRLEGHAWQGKIWVPFPLVLDYLQVPYRWDPSSAVLELVEG